MTFGPMPVSLSPLTKPRDTTESSQALDDSHHGLALADVPPDDGARGGRGLVAIGAARIGAVKAVREFNDRLRTNMLQLGS
jgi:hypothetical protein